MKKESEVLSLLNVEPLRLRLNKSKKIEQQKEDLKPSLFEHLFQPEIIISDENVPQTLVNATIPIKALHQKLNQIYEVFLSDVDSAKSRILSLDSTRRKLIERRLEVLARRIAFDRKEKFNRSISLFELLSSHDLTSSRTIAESWRTFKAEVALYSMFEIFFLKSLEFHGYHRFEKEELRKLNFSVHQILQHNANHFSNDHHCWNFVRTNLYSWYVPSIQHTEKLHSLIQELENVSPMAWSDHDLLQWVTELSKNIPEAQHFKLNQDIELSSKIIHLIERETKLQFVEKKNTANTCLKVFLPTANRGGLILNILDRLLSEVPVSLTKLEKQHSAESVQLQNSIWACETESFELFWVEIMSLLKVLRSTGSDQMHIATQYSGLFGHTDEKPFRLPHVIHAANTLSLELHNLDQLPLRGPEVAHIQQGTALQIQLLESFDLSIVTDCPNQLKSQQWLNALAEQLPYWKSYLRSSSNINWGELHLHLALSKLKENGRCIYLAHRQLPDGKDADKMRKKILSENVLEHVIEIKEASESSPFRYIYIFRKCSQKSIRDYSRAKLTKIRSLPSLETLDRLETDSIQSEWMEFGWDKIYVHGNFPLIRQLNSKFSKLFQFAAVVGHTKEVLESKRDYIAILQNKDGVEFKKSRELKSLDRVQYAIFPHQPESFDWLLAFLSTDEVKMWIDHYRKQAPSGMLKLSELKNIPVYDLKKIDVQYLRTFEESLLEISKTYQNIKSWAFADNDSEFLPMRYIAIQQRISSLELLLNKYKPLFLNWSNDDKSDLQFRPESIPHFYPDRLLSSWKNSPEFRIQVVGQEACSIPTDDLIITDIELVKSPRQCLFILKTKQGPQLQCKISNGVEDYVYSQLQSLKGKSWSEINSQVLTPIDVRLYVVQTTEICRVLKQTRVELKALETSAKEISATIYDLKAHS